MSTLGNIRASITQRKAVELYLTNGGDKIDAYVRSRATPISPNTPASAIKRKAHGFFKNSTITQLMAEADIQTKLKLERKSEMGLENALDTYGITKERIIAELAKIAFAQQTDVASWGPDGVIVKDSKDIGDAAAAVGEVSQTGGGEQPDNVKIKMLDKQAALVRLGKEVFGMFTDKVEHRGVVAVGAKFILEGK